MSSSLAVVYRSCRVYYYLAMPPIRPMLKEVRHDPHNRSDALAGMRCTFATVLAVVTWDREGSDPHYQGQLNCDSWEVVVPELVFEPDS